MIRDATSWTYWTDVAERTGWRWQVSNDATLGAPTVHRLIDPAGQTVQMAARDIIQQRWCEAVDFANAQNADQDKPCVLILHGLGRTQRSMYPLLKGLQQRLPDYEMKQFAYASLINRIDDHATALLEFLSWSLGSRPVIFVAHSLGNIVLRRMYRLLRERGGLWLPEQSVAALNLKGHAMLGPPNQGSLIAKRISQMPGTRWVMGPSFLQVGPQWDELRDSLDLPPCPVAIIAGDVPSLRRMHPLLPAPNDGLVTVEEARLSPEQEIEIYPILHSLFMYDRRVYDSLAKHLHNWLSLSPQLPPTANF